MDNKHALASLAALAHETRLEVFRHLVRAGPRGVPAGEIATRLDVVQNTMSSHLAILNRAGLIASRRDGREVIYRASYDAMRDLLLYLLDDCCQGDPEICAPIVAAMSCQC